MKILTQELLEVKHCCVVFISAVGEISHHEGGTVILLVCPQEGHAGVLALVKVIGLEQKHRSSVILSLYFFLKAFFSHSY